MSSILFGFQNPLFHFVWLTHLVSYTLYVLFGTAYLSNLFSLLDKFSPRKKLRCVSVVSWVWLNFFDVATLLGLWVFISL